MNLTGKAGANGKRELIAFRIGGQEFCVDVMSVREIRGWTPSVPLPGGPDHVEGVCDLRGHVIPVISMVARLGLEPTGAAPTVTVVIEDDGRLVGVAVDSVCDLVPVPSARLQPTPAVGGAGARELLSAVVELEGRVYGLIDFTRLGDLGAERAP